MSVHRKLLPWQVAAAVTAEALHELQELQQQQQEQQELRAGPKGGGPSGCCVFSLGPSLTSFPLVSLSFPLLLEATGRGPFAAPSRLPLSTAVEGAAPEGLPALQLLDTGGLPKERPGEAPGVGAPHEAEVAFAVVQASPVSTDLWLVLSPDSGLNGDSLAVLDTFEERGLSPEGPPLVVLNASCFGGPQSPWKGLLASGGGQHSPYTPNEAPKDTAAGASPDSNESGGPRGAPERAQRKKTHNRRSTGSSNAGSSNNSSNSISSRSLVSEECLLSNRGGLQSPGTPAHGVPGAEGRQGKALGIAVRLGAGCGGEAAGCPAQGCRHEVAAVEAFVSLLQTVYPQGKETPLTLNIKRKSLSSRTREAVAEYPACTSLLRYLVYRPYGLGFRV